MKRSKRSRAGHLPLRTCAGCRQVHEKHTLLRVVRGIDDVVTVDGSGSAPGRGAYICPDLGCIALAKKRRTLERSLRCRVPEYVYAHLAQLVTNRDAPD